ncbi:hypothetical protein EJB05_23827, partial [Eragrostis curvula]
MIYALHKDGRRDEAENMFSAIFANDLVPNKVSYTLMIESRIKEGLLQEADDLFLSMEKNNCVVDSRLLNSIVSSLLQKGEVCRTGAYLAKIDEKNFSLEAATKGEVSRDGAYLSKIDDEKFLLAASTNSLLITIISETEYCSFVEVIDDRDHPKVSDWIQALSNCMDDNTVTQMPPCSRTSACHPSTLHTLAVLTAVADAPPPSSAGSRHVDSTAGPVRLSYLALHPRSHNGGARPLASAVRRRLAIGAGAVFF